MDKINKSLKIAKKAKKTNKQTIEGNIWDMKIEKGRIKKTEEIQEIESLGKQAGSTDTSITNRI